MKIHCSFKDDISKEERVIATKMIFDRKNYDKITYAFMRKKHSWKVKKDTNLKNTLRLYIKTLP